MLFIVFYASQQRTLDPDSLLSQGFTAEIPVWRLNDGVMVQHLTGIFAIISFACAGQSLLEGWGDRHAQKYF